MNLTKQKTTFISFLCACFMLSACGIKGDLYQTTKPVKADDMVVEDSAVEKSVATKENPQNQKQSIDQPSLKKAEQ